MPRIRSLKPEVWQDEAMAELERDARLLFIGLITQADDEGRLKGDPRLIGAQVFPYDALPPDQVAAWLAELDRVGLIQRYEHAGRPLIALSGWHHQKINRPSPSPIPAPPNAGSSTAHEPFSEDSLADRIKDQGEDQDQITTSEADASDAASAETDPRQQVPTAGRLSDLLADLVADNDPDRKRPQVSKRWLDAERLLVTQDGRGEAQVEAVIRWVQADDFERSNVLSMPKLRERYRELLGKSQRGRLKAVPTKPREVVL